MIIKPDEILADLERQLETAPPEQRAAIQAQINARRSEVMKELGVTNMGWGSGGYMIPGKGQVPDGTVVLEPTNTPGVFTASRISSASSESYGRVPSGTEGDVVDPFKSSKLEFFDASGRKLTANEVAGTKVARDFAQAGWDVGSGAGVETVPTKYKDIVANQGPTPPGGNAYYDAERNVFVVNDYNGVSLYDSNGNLIYGKGSQWDIGFSGGGLKGQVDIPGVGPADSPEYNPNAKPNKISTSFSNNTSNANNTSNVSNNVNTSNTNLTTAQRDAKSAYDLLYSQFQQYGLGSLVEELKGYITEGLSPSEFTIKLRDSKAYQKRFAANQARIQKGLRALSEAEYINLEDQYQDVMRRYGMPESYYTRGDMGVQPGFEKFISQDVSPVELEDRVQTAYNRVINANPEVSIALKNFYPGITNGDILAYALDPNEALDKIKRKITAAEIGGAAVQAGLTTNESDAEYLARYGITKEQAQQGYRTISGYLPRAQQLSSIYGKQVEGGPYTQASAEQEIFGVPGAAEAERKRKQITALETAAFSGSSGLTGGALGRERAGSF